MRVWKSQLAQFLIVGFLLGTAALFAADETPTHALDEKEKEAILKSEGKDQLVTRQQALITALQEMKLPRAPLERLSEFLEKNPKASPEQFNKILESVAETMPGVFNNELKAKLKKLYLDELGNVKVNPATEFIAAAKAVAGKLPVVPSPINPPANPNNPNDPNNTVSSLSGATITPPVKSADSFPDISKLSRGSEDAKGLKALEDKLSTLQDAFARQQNGSQSGAGGTAGQGENGGLASQLLGLLRKEGEGKEKKGSGEDRGSGRSPEHSPAKQAAEPSGKEDSKETKRSDLDTKRDRDKDRDSNRRRGGAPQQSNNEKSSGNGKEDKKEDKDKDKKAEPLFADKPVEKKEKPKPPEEKAPETPADDSLADAANVLTGKPKKTISLGEGTAGNTIQAQPASASGSNSPDPGPPQNTNNGGSGPVVGGQNAQASGGGGSGLGETPSAGGGGDTGQGGPAGGAYNFIRMTEYTSGYGGDGGGSAADSAGGYSDDSPTTPARRPGGPQFNGEPLRMASLPEAGKGWLLDIVGHWKKKICEGPDRGKVEICFKAVGPGHAAAGNALQLRAGIQ